jgi:hypothetical protein
MYQAGFISGLIRNNLCSMIKTIFSILAILCFNICLCQSLSPFVFASGGIDYSKNEYRLSYTIGEVVVETFHSNNRILTQGFQQGPAMFVNGIKSISFPDLDVTVFPNPASEMINVVIRNYKLSNDYVVEIYNMLGQKFSLPVKKLNNYNSEQIEIDISGIDKGAYFVRILDSKLEKGYADFKVIKIR